VRHGPGAVRRRAGEPPIHSPRGDRVFVHGTITTDAWNDKDSGAKRTAQLVLAEIIAPSPDYPHPGQR